jgi:hypothetical protein
MHLVTIRSTCIFENNSQPLSSFWDIIRNYLHQFIIGYKVTRLWGHFCSKCAKTYSVTPLKITYSWYELKTSIFWYIAPCSLLKINRRFGGTDHFQFPAGLLLGLLYNFEVGGEIFLRIVWLIFNGLHGVISYMKNTSYVYGCNDLRSYKLTNQFLHMHPATFS